MGIAAAYAMSDGTGINKCNRLSINDCKKKRLPGRGRQAL